MPPTLGGRWGDVPGIGVSRAGGWVFPFGGGEGPGRPKGPTPHGPSTRKSINPTFLPSPRVRRETIPGWFRVRIYGLPLPGPCGRDKTRESTPWAVANPRPLRSWKGNRPPRKPPRPRASVPSPPPIRGCGPRRSGRETGPWVLWPRSPRESPKNNRGRWVRPPPGGPMLGRLAVGPSGPNGLPPWGRAKPTKFPSSEEGGFLLFNPRAARTRCVWGDQRWSPPLLGKVRPGDGGGGPPVFGVPSPSVPWEVPGKGPGADRWMGGKGIGWDRWGRYSPPGTLGPARGGNRSGIEEGCCPGR